MNAQFGLSTAAVQTIRAVLGDFPQIQKALLFGSRAKGNPKPGSDIDLALIGPDLNTPLLLRIETALDDQNLPYRIDLLIHHHITNPELRDHITRLGIPFYQPASHNSMTPN